ncbi:hypothetical protein FA13DRAFT_1725483 [Coprinellus micaceus]|uniref:Glutathione hydrolase n=1 Tax=Coprinellus micaceus TaxID=71717 RepID=A0A4Y7TUL7_COPMI|nr:hypothetical protein FA13DRAFT_1725483 [Coprinellus micaceus]
MKVGDSTYVVTPLLRLLPLPLFRHPRKASDTETTLVACLCTRLLETEAHFNSRDMAPSSKSPVPSHPPTPGNPPVPPRRQRLDSRFKLPLLVTALFAIVYSRYASGSILVPDEGDQSHITRIPQGKLVVARHGAVASEVETCSDIGVETLKAGGNAVDAAVSTTLCVGVVNMFSSGIGGGGFMTVRIPPSPPSTRSEVYTIDFRETAPSLSNATMFVPFPSRAGLGGLSVAIPGELRGLAEIHRRWGVMKWEDLVLPSAEVAAGWRVGKELAWRIGLYEKLMLEDEDWRAIFAPNGRILREGEWIRRTNLSRTLRTIATEGPEAFYRGPIADSLIHTIDRTGGILTSSDLESYIPIVRRALEGSWESNGVRRTVYTTQAPTSGPVLLHLLHLMEGVQERKLQGLNVGVHRVVEAIKIADPDFVDETVLERMNHIPTKEYAKGILANLTDDTTHPSSYYQPEYDVPVNYGTSHSSIIDSNGMAVSITSSINRVFGSQVMDPETGVILNDEMDDFSIPGVPNGWGVPPSPQNFPAPHKRPLSSTAPSIIENEDGSVFLVAGGAGGSRIFPAVFQAILNADAEERATSNDTPQFDLSSAVERSRLHNQLFPNIVDIDRPLGDDVVEALHGRGHEVKFIPPGRTSAVVNVVGTKAGLIFAASDSRKNGVAAGY